MSDVESRAVVLLRGSVSRASAWVVRGTVPAHVVPVSSGWTAVVAAGEGYAAEPYQDAGVMLMCRPTPGLMRPSLGVLTSGDRVTFVVQGRSFRGGSKWLLSQAGVGIRTTALPPASAADLLAVTKSPATGRVEQLLAGRLRADQAPGSTPGEALAGAVLHELGLGTAAQLLREVPKTARRVAPAPKSVRRFDANISAEAEERREVESWLR